MGFLDAIIVITGFVVFFLFGYQVGKLNNKINETFKSE